jgi:hypothetical protein
LTTLCFFSLCDDRFRKSEAEKILKGVLDEKMLVWNERDKKGRLSTTYASEDAAETIGEIVDACQKAVVGARRACSAAALARTRRSRSGRPSAHRPLRRPRVASPRAEGMRTANNDQPPRYKLIFQATMGENQQQLVRSASRCLWDPKYDNVASASWNNPKIYAVVMCFALYYE